MKSMSPQQWLDMRIAHGDRPNLPLGIVGREVIISPPTFPYGTWERVYLFPLGVKGFVKLSDRPITFDPILLVGYKYADFERLFETPPELKDD